MATTDPLLPPDRDLGVLLIGHGTASEVGTGQFLYLARQLAELLAPTPVEPAFLELQQPDIATGLCRLIERGVARHLTMPLLLFGAGHAKRDVPLAVQCAIQTLFTELTSQKSSARIAKAQWAGKNAFFLHCQTEHLGCHDAMIELSQYRYRETVVEASPVPPDRTALVLVGRGSRDDSATAEMHEFARLRHQPEAAGETFVGFLAMARPPFGEVLAIAASRGFRRVVVQPHLLFAGELADTIEREVSRMQVAHPDQEWLASPLLADSQDSPSGGNQFLLRAMSDRIRAAIRVVASGQGD